MGARKTIDRARLAWNSPFCRTEANRKHQSSEGFDLAEFGNGCSDQNLRSDRALAAPHHDARETGPEISSLSLALYC